MSENTLEQLYQKLDQLVRYCDELKADNRALREREEQWQQERDRLIEKNEMAKGKVEAMIGHLKQLQQSAG